MRLSLPILALVGVLAVPASAQTRADSLAVLGVLVGRFPPPPGITDSVPGHRLILEVADSVPLLGSLLAEVLGGLCLPGSPTDATILDGTLMLTQFRLRGDTAWLAAETTSWRTGSPSMPAWGSFTSWLLRRGPDGTWQPWDSQRGHWDGELTGPVPALTACTRTAS